MKRCRIEHCGESLSAASRLDTCPTCRAYTRRWDKRRPAEVLDRRHRLNVWYARLEALVPAEVREIKRKQASAPVEVKRRRRAA